MAANQMEFGKAMKEKLVPVFERYGLELDAFAVQNVSLPEELQKVLDTKIGMNMIGDMGVTPSTRPPTRFRWRRRTRGGLAGIGAGLGAGVGIGRPWPVRWPGP